MEPDKRLTSNEILAELLRRKNGKAEPQKESAALLALLLAGKALSMIEPDGSPVDFDRALPIRPPVA